MSTYSENMKQVVKMLLATANIAGGENDRIYIDDSGIERFGDNAPTYVLILQNLATN